MYLLLRRGRDARKRPIPCPIIEAHHPYPAGQSGSSHYLHSPTAQEYVMSNEPDPLPLHGAPERETLNLPELAVRLGVSRTSIYRWAKDGTLPTIRLGRRLLVPRAALEELLDPRSTAQNQPSPGS